MNLTPQEQKMVAQLRKKQSLWRYARWINLIAGIALMGACAYILHEVSHLMKSGDPVGFASWSIIGPFVTLAFAAGIYHVTTAIQNWRGHPVETLLLKLFEEPPPS